MASLFFWASACPASAIPNTTVPTTITRQFMLILLWLSRQPGQDGLGLSHDLLDHLSGGLDRADQARRLPAGRAPVLYVPQLPGTNGGLAAHDVDLGGERLDLVLAPLPGLRERVPDEPARFAGRGPGHHGALFVNLDDPVLVVLVAVGLRRGDEARAHPHPDGPEGQRR